MTTLQHYIDDLTRQVLNLDGELNDMHVEEWKRPHGKQMLHELDILTQCLAHAHAFQACRTAGKGVGVQVQ